MPINKNTKFGISACEASSGFKKVSVVGFSISDFSLNKSIGSSMSINRISPVDARKQLETARAMTNSGIEFVCVPVYDGNRLEVRALAMSALDKLISEVEGGDDDR